VVYNVASGIVLPKNIGAHKDIPMTRVPANCILKDDILKFYISQAQPISASLFQVYVLSSMTKFFFKLDWAFKIRKRMPDVAKIHKQYIDKFTEKFLKNSSNIILRVIVQESAIYVLFAGFAMLVTDFNVLPTQTAVQSEVSVDSQSKLQVPFSETGTTSEKTVWDFVVSANYTEELDVTISLKDMTESAYTFPKTFPNLTFCSEVFINLSLKLERMNISIHKALDKFSYEYEHFLHIDRYHDPHMDNVMICQTVENGMKLHLQDTDKVADFLIFNCSTDLDDSYTDIKLNIMKLSDICWLYNETESIIFSLAEKNQNLVNSTIFLFNRLFTSHDVFTFRNLVKSYDEVIEQLNGFTRRKILLYNSASSRNLSFLLNTSFMLNYSDFQTETIKLTLQEYNYWKNILIASKNGTRYDILLFVRVPLYSLILIIGLIGNCTMLVIFALHSEIRKPSDLLILNLVISDILNIITNIIPHFVTELNSVDPFLNYGVLTCQIITGLEFTSIGSSAWNVVAFSIQRYRVFIMSSGNLDRKICCVPNKRFTFICIAAVWILAVALAVPNSLDAGVYVNGACSYLSDVQYILYRLLAYGVIPLVIITILYTLTAGRLARSARGMPGEIQGLGTQKRARIKSAKVLISLTVVFALSYMPYFLISYFAKLGIIHENSISEYVGALIFFLLFVNSAVNPVAIYISSANYRKYFNRYLCACFCAKPCREGTHHPTARVV
jgi:hypothetical protein